MIDSLMTKNRVKQIKGLLLEERQRILEGPLIDIIDLANRREKLVDLLVASNSVPSPTDLKEINDYASHNQRLLLVSIKGVKEAQVIIAAQVKAQTSLGTYTESGQRIDAPCAVMKNDRRL